MTILQAIILGVVEGITEFLPISSTGHLILTTKILGLAETEFVKSFEVIIQVGAILAVVAMYWRLLLKNFELWKKIAVAFLPAAVIGFALYPFIKGFLLGSAEVVLWSLAIGGVLIILFEKWHQEHEEDVDEVTGITYKQALIIGLFQALAVVPGVSRAAATIIGGLYVGLKRTTIVEFSFLLAVPTMLAASGFDLLQSANNFTSGNIWALAVGFATSFAVAWLAIKFLLKFIKTHTFVGFGVYRIAIAILFFLVFFL